MCLDSICKEIPKFKKEHGHFVGWKIYQGYSTCYSNRLIPQWQGIYQPIGTWIHEKDYRNTKELKQEKIYVTEKQKNSYLNSYLKGFHIYLKPTKDCFRCDFVVRKVYFDKVVAFGKQKSDFVVVAKKIKILRQRRCKGE